MKDKEVKLYSCNNCGKKVRIRSKGLCPACRAKQLNKKPKLRSKKTIRQREGYSDFFKRHVFYIKSHNICCQNCGDKLRGEVSEVAHILSKRNFGEVATKDWNVLYLCGMFSENRCHDRFDKDLATRKGMKVFKKACEVVQLHRDEIKHINNELLQLIENDNEQEG